MWTKKCYCEVGMKLLHDTKAREQLLYGINTVANAVNALGPHGRNVIIDMTVSARTMVSLLQKRYHSITPSQTGRETVARGRGQNAAGCR